MVAYDFPARSRHICTEVLEESVLLMPHDMRPLLGFLATGIGEPVLSEMSPAPVITAKFVGYNEILGTKPIRVSLENFQPPVLPGLPLKGH